MEEGVSTVYCGPTTSGSKYALSVIAGYLDPQKEILRIHKKDGSDYVDIVEIFHGIEREIYEETGIAAYDVVELVCLGIIANRKQNQMNIPFCGTLNIRLRRGSNDKIENSGFRILRDSLRSE